MIHNSALLRWLVLLVAILAAARAAYAQQADSALVKAHVAAATRAAGSDLRSIFNLCKTAEDTAPPNFEELHQRMLKAMATGSVEPMRVFDNLYFVGSKWVSSWAVQTSAGIILIDAMDNDEEARTIIADGLRKLGLDPATIRYAILTHAHGDHYGGIGYLVEHFHPRVVMSDADWRELEQPKLQFDVPEWGRPPKRDLSVKDGDTVTLGDTTVELILTPGHTSGTLSVVLPVRDGGTPHRALLWGGTAFNFGKRADRLNLYIASSGHAAAIVRKEHVDVVLSNHAGTDDSVAKMAALRLRQAAQPHPYVLGQPAVERFLTVAGECAAATLASFDAGALPASMRSR